MAFALFKNQFELEQEKWERRLQSKGPMARRVADQKVQMEFIQEKKNQIKPKKPEKGKEKEKVNIDIKMETPRRVEKFGINFSESKEKLEEVWEGFNEYWKQYSKIKGMYENKLAELEDEMKIRTISFLPFRLTRIFSPESN